MGTQLLSLYDHAKSVGGLDARIKLAMVTKMSSTQANDAPDSPENIRLFESALRQLGLR
jgi:hypothetical protein